MATIAHTDRAPLLHASQALAELHRARGRTLALIAPLSEQQLEAVHSPLMSPLVWDLGHIAAYEDLWLVHRYGGRDLLRADLAAAYDAFETPRAERGEIEILDREGAKAYMQGVRERTRAVIEQLGVGDGRLHEMVLQHEHQHNETMLQTLRLARIPWPLAAGHRGAPTWERDLVSSMAAPTGLELLDVPAGPFQMGAPDERFSYDNERPRHEVDVPAFRIGATPVTNAGWLAFVRAGGYERREWWSPEGWAARNEIELALPGGWRANGEQIREWHGGRWEPLRLDRPVSHVCWYEADAFARAHGLRLPTEAEWEKAATFDPRDGETLSWPWGSAPPSPKLANLYGDGRFATAPVGAHPEGAAPSGALGMIGGVWEWTATPFGGYDGFHADPYPEYSEVFFGEPYRVLRGGSWASDPSVATATFRNWDLPQRRQIFAGLRLAGDAR